MRRLLIIAAAIFASTISLTSCEQSQVRQGRKLYKAYFEYILKDPESLIIHKEKYTLEKEHTVIWELDYSAKNSLGGRQRKREMFQTIGNTIIVDGEHYDYNDLK